jgi:hypothetical protein
MSDSAQVWIPAYTVTARVLHWLIGGAHHALDALRAAAAAAARWIATSAYPAPVPVFGLFELPRIWSENRALSAVPPRYAPR